MRQLICMMIVLMGLAAPATVGEQRLTIFERDCWVYTPKQIDPDKTYWLVVGVHPYLGDGRGACGITDWVDKYDCIVVGPSFPNDGYTLLQRDADKQLLAVYKAMAQRYKLHPKMFLHGFSGGGQFVSRFIMKHPDSVIGAAAHSAGTWPTDKGWGAVNPKANTVPLAISCGMSDTIKSYRNVPYGRLEWARRFEQQVRDAGFLYKAAYWPGKGHNDAFLQCKKLSEECFEFVTHGVPADQQALVDRYLRALDLAVQRRDAGLALKRVEQLMKLTWPKPLTRQVDAREVDARGWSAGEAFAEKREQIRRTAFDLQTRARLTTLHDVLKARRASLPDGSAQAARDDEQIAMLEAYLSEKEPDSQNPARH